MPIYKLTVTTLSPLHIGDGNELRQGFDFIVAKNRTYRLNVDAILAEKSEHLTPRRNGSYPLPAELLSSADLQNPAFFRYNLTGFPRSSKTDARLKSCIKDVYDCAYIPGSSLKGALRTALAWTGWTEIKPRLDRAAFGRSRSWAGQPLEKKLFGLDPNHDLLRALQVSDCTGSCKPGSRLMVVNAQVLTHKSAGSPVELEAISGDTKFTGTLRVNDALFSPMAERVLGFSNRRHWLDELLPRVNSHSLARMKDLSNWFDETDGGKPIASFYRQLAGYKLAPNQAFMQLGWGTGWDGSTFWTHLQQDKYLFEQIVRDFRMHKANRSSQPRKPGDPFPRSKRAAMKIVEGPAAPAAPLGWVLLEINNL